MLAALLVIFFSLFTWGQETQVNKLNDKREDVEAVKPHDGKISKPTPPPATVPAKKESASKGQNPWGDGGSIYDNDMGC